MNYRCLGQKRATEIDVLGPEIGSAFGGSDGITQQKSPRVQSRLYQFCVEPRGGDFNAVSGRNVL